MAIQLDAVTFEVVDAAAGATFWAGLLGRDMIAEADGVLVPGDAGQVGLRFVTSDAEPSGRPRLHLHITSSDPEDQQRTVDAALQLGGHHLDVGQGPDEGFVVLADPCGNELCVIEPDNKFLAGTGRLGEVTCDGARAVGLFWHDALDWPLVWDQDGETALQAPSGGTKVSFSGSPVENRGRTRQRFDLVTTDQASAVDRLVSLGATQLVDLSDRIELTDPDGNQFDLRSLRS